MSATKKLQIDLPNGRHGSIQNPNPDGVKLPPIPMSMALAIALEVEASRNFRSPRDQAMLILETHFGLKHPSLVRRSPTAPRFTQASGLRLVKTDQTPKKENTNVEAT